MTKLGEWLLGLTVFFGIYAALVTKQIKHQFIDDFFFEVQILPLVLIALLGIYAVVTVLYRTLTFNDCTEAAEEIQRQIKEARADLRTKGMKFDHHE